MPKYMQYDKDQLTQAVSAVKQRKMKIAVASREFKVPKKTIADHVHGKVM